MSHKFISLGSWCGTAASFKKTESLPFDSVRSTIKGVIDC